MNYQIELSRIAIKSLRSFPRADLKKIQSKIDKLIENPKPRDSKKLKGDSYLHRIRSGDYRILYKIFEAKLIILIINIGHRKDIYRKL